MALTFEYRLKPPDSRLPELTLRPGDRLVFLGAGSAWSSLLGWLSGVTGFNERHPDPAPVRSHAVRERLVREYRGRWPFRRKAGWLRQDPTVDDVRRVVAAVEKRPRELLLADDPPAETIGLLLAAQERTGCALIVGTRGAKIAEGIGGTLYVAEMNDLWGPSSFADVLARPPDKDTAKRLGWVVDTIYRSEPMSGPGARPGTMPGPVTIADGVTLGLAWAGGMRIHDTFNASVGPMHTYEWSAAWGVPPGNWLLDPPSPPPGWLIVSGTVSWIVAETREIWVNAGSLTFPFTVEAHAPIPAKGTPMRVAWDPRRAAPIGGP